MSRERDHVQGSPLKPGAVLLGRYEYVRELGRGAMGEVLEVRDRASGQRYALKRIPPELIRDHAQMEAVRANFGLVQGLTHPHIAATRFLETEHSTGQVQILMDLVRGRNLQVWLQESPHRQADPDAPLPLPIALGIAEQAASALDYAHSMPIYDDAGNITRSGILHRDLKPANMMVVDGREYRPGVPFVQLVDFGLAAEIQASMLSTTMLVDDVNIKAGTPLYMAPEQWAGRTLTRAIDQWALAVMLYEMVEGGPPFHASTRKELRLLVLTGEPMPPQILSPSQWASLKIAFERDRTKRYPNCLSLVQAVAAASPSGRAERAAAAPRPGDVRTLEPAPTSDWAKGIAETASAATASWGTASGTPTPAEADPTTAYPATDAVASPAPIRRRTSGRLSAGVVLTLLGLLSWWAAVTFRVETPAGTIVVEVDQSDVDVFVDGRRRVTIRQAGEETPITLEADGERHELKLVKDGFSVYMREFALKNGDRRTIQVSLVPKPAPSSSTALPSANGPTAVNSTTAAPPPQTFASAPAVSRPAAPHSTRSATAAVPVAPPAPARSSEAGTSEGEERAAAAAAHRTTTPQAGTRAGEERSDNVLGMKMVWCPPGKFLMGSPATDQDASSDEKPQVEVELPNGFWLGKYEVTQREWKGLMGTEPWKGGTYMKEGADNAASYVSWADAESFCRKLTEGDTAAGKVGDDWIYRLPSEAEWEYACRAGSRTRYAFGDDAGELGKYAWYGENAYDVNESYAHGVGLKRGNVWGLHDLHGNVMEWCGDWHGDRLVGGRNPKGSSNGSTRVIRGGGWYRAAGYCRSALRSGYSPSLRYGDLGFRVARVLGSR